MEPGWADWAACLALAVALAATAGLRAWLPLLLAGLLARFELLTLGEDFALLSSDTALAVFAVATVLEIAADKLPALDHALDVVSTAVRPAAGSILAASAIGVVADPLTALVLGVVVGAPTALVPHGLKSALRATSSALTGGLANPVLSLLEDLLAVVMFVLAVVVPLLVIAALGLAAWLVLRRTRRRPMPQAT